MSCRCLSFRTRRKGGQHKRARPAAQVKENANAAPCDHKSRRRPRHTTAAEPLAPATSGQRRACVWEHTGNSKGATKVGSWLRGRRTWAFSAGPESGLRLTEPATANRATKSPESVICCRHPDQVAGPPPLAGLEWQQRGGRRGVPVFAFRQNLKPENFSLPRVSSLPAGPAH
jgi:hypothetical protein